jgi:hypothetical protein
VSTHRRPDLTSLIRALTADGQPGELADRDAARAAFLAESQRHEHHAADRAAGRHRDWRHRGWRPRGARPRRPASVLSRRLAAAAAGVIAVAGRTTAAYTRALPGPAQDIAHTVFAPLGLPARPQPSAPAGSPAAVTIATPGGKSGQAGGAASRTPSAPPADDYLLTLTASRVRVPAGAVVELGGRLTDRGRSVAGAPVRLFERLAGSATWELAATGVTGPRGGFLLLSPPVTTTAVFRVVAGPDNAHSAAVRVSVPPSPGNGDRSARPRG